MENKHFLGRIKEKYPFFHMATIKFKAGVNLNAISAPLTWV